MGGGGVCVRVCSVLGEGVRGVGLGGGLNAESSGRSESEETRAQVAQAHGPRGGCACGEPQPADREACHVGGIALRSGVCRVRVSGSERSGGKANARVHVVVRSCPVVVQCFVCEPM